MLSSHHTCNVTLLTCLARKYDNLVTQIILHQKVLLISLGTLQMLLLWNWEHIPVLILGPLIITLSLSLALFPSHPPSLFPNIIIFYHICTISLSLFPFTFTLLSPKHYLYYLSRSLSCSLLLFLCLLYFSIFDYYFLSLSLSLL